MNLLGIGDIIKGVGSIADDLFTSDEERLKVALQEKQIDASLMLGQQSINMAEAKHGSTFVAGWRPFIGWVGGIALAYQFVLYPLLLWIWAIAQAKGWIPPCVYPQDISPENITAASQCKELQPPVIDASALYPIILGMLGIGSMRSYDKLKGTDTKKVSNKKQ